jgi:hypothetical protein
MSGLLFPGKVAAGSGTRPIVDRGFRTSSHRRVDVAPTRKAAANSSASSVPVRKVVRTAPPGPPRSDFRTASIARGRSASSSPTPKTTLIPARSTSLRERCRRLRRVQGEMGNDRRGGAKTTSQALNSPWDLAHRDGDSSSRWRGRVGALDPRISAGARRPRRSGNGRENLKDGAADSAKASLSLQIGIPRRKSS